MDTFSYLLGKSKGGGGPSPSGTIEITSNGTYDVTSKATANVNVPTSGIPIPTITAGTSTKGSFWSTLENIEKIMIEGNEGAYMFKDYAGAKIPKLEGTENLTNMSNMFVGTTTENINLNYFNTSNVTNMQYAFNTCKAKYIDLSNWNVSNVTTMSMMFASCSNLTILDISSFDNANANPYRMFRYAGSQCLQSDGAYADGIPYIYVKNAEMQNWVLSSDSHPATWTTANVVIKS